MSDIKRKKRKNSRKCRAEYCEKEQVLFREDESNKSDVYTRNRIRKYIVPELVKESPSIYEHARMISEQLSEMDFIKFLHRAFCVVAEYMAVAAWHGCDAIDVVYHA